MEAQIVGTVTLSHSDKYQSSAAFVTDREQHRIAKGGSYDWDGKGEMHAWHVGKVQRFRAPVNAGQKSQTGYGTAKTSEVTFESDADALS